MTQDATGVSITVARGARDDPYAAAADRADGAHSAVRKSPASRSKAARIRDNLIVTVRFPSGPLEGLSGVTTAGATAALLAAESRGYLARGHLPAHRPDHRGATGRENSRTPCSTSSRSRSATTSSAAAPTAPSAHGVALSRSGACFSRETRRPHQPNRRQGLNGGVHDALNLSRKLAAVVLRGEPESLLDGYERQRRPIVEKAIIAQSDANRARMREPDPEKRREILRGLQAICADPVKAYERALETSMITGLRQAAAVA